MSAPAALALPPPRGGETGGESSSGESSGESGCEARKRKRRRHEKRDGEKKRKKEKKKKAHKSARRAHGKDGESYSAINSPGHSGYNTSLCTSMDTQFAFQPPVCFKVSLLVSSPPPCPHLIEDWK